MPLTRSSRAALCSVSSRPYPSGLAVQSPSRSHMELPPDVPQDDVVFQNVALVRGDAAQAGFQAAEHVLPVEAAGDGVQCPSSMVMGAFSSRSLRRLI